jgi:hypothetical protein
VKYGEAFGGRPPAARTRIKRGLTFVLRDIIAAERELPHGPERSEVAARLRDIVTAIRDLEARLLGPFVPKVIGARP